MLARFAAVERAQAKQQTRADSLRLATGPHWDRTTRPAADLTSRSCCRRSFSAAGACGALGRSRRALAFCNSTINCTTNCLSTAGSSGNRAAVRKRHGVRAHARLYAASSPVVRARKKSFPAACVQPARTYRFWRFTLAGSMPHSTSDSSCTEISILRVCGSLLVGKRNVPSSSRR